MRIINIPIEDLEMRYSADWNTWFPREFRHLGIRFLTFEGERIKTGIEKGSFLDVCDTNYYKALQMGSIALNLDRGNIGKEDDVFFFHDLWNPTVCQLSYMRSALDLKFKITGVLHAGCWDYHDFLYKKGMSEWAVGLEESILKIADAVFVATDFHKNMIMKEREIGNKRIHVTGLPLYPIELQGDPPLKEKNRIVFPHRLDSEKNPEHFESLMGKLSKNFGNAVGVMTAKVCKTKQEYYDELAKAEYSVSFANQETWGYAMMESMLLGCVPVVPDKLSYKELYPLEFKYEKDFIPERSCFNILSRYMGELTSKPDITNLRESLLLKGKLAIPKMVSHMYDLF